jgi:(p)ppGpp synthase/HD superfamily hydrolase
MLRQLIDPAPEPAAESVLPPLALYVNWTTWSAAKFALSDMVSRSSIEIIGQAFDFACRMHGGQRRFNGKPYWTHLLETLEIIAVGVGEKREAVLVAAVLHDVVEDTAATISDIRQRFGATVARCVDLLTQDGDRESYLSRFKADVPEHVRTVKLADRLSNVQRLHLDRSHQREYFQETLAHFMPLAQLSPFFRAQFELWRRRYSYLVS